VAEFRIDNVEYEENKSAYQNNTKIIEHPLLMNYTIDSSFNKIVNGGDSSKNLNMLGV